MNCVQASLAIALSFASLTTPTLARDLKTMHAENSLPRPVNVEISGARPDQVVLYCTTTSAGCKTIRGHLHKMGVDYLDKDPGNDEVAGAEFDALGGQGVPLIVFKDRLMHGYYPSSFDRLYAQHKIGRNAASTLGTSGRAPSAEEVASSTKTTAISRLWSGVDDVAPADIETYLKANPDVVVQFTSPDPGCGFCVDGSTQRFDAIAAAYAGRVRFARVQWSPWQDVPKEVWRLVGRGVPVQVAFKSGHAARFMGTIQAPKREAAFTAWLAQIFGRVQ